MSNFDQALSDDAAAFANSDEFGETTSYMPISGDPIHSIEVFVSRPGPERDKQTGQVISPQPKAFIRKDASGVLGPSDCRVGDAISIHRLFGEDPETFKVTKVEHADAAGWWVQLR